MRPGEEASYYGLLPTCKGQKTGESQLVLVRLYLKNTAKTRTRIPSNKNVTEGSKSMPTEDKMTVTERRKYLKRMKPLYDNASRCEQSRILTEMEQVLNVNDFYFWHL